jgi:hypothetical protein
MNVSQIRLSLAAGLLCVGAAATAARAQASVNETRDPKQAQ